MRFRLANTEFVISESGAGSTASVFRTTKSIEAVTSLPRLRPHLLFKNVLQIVSDDLGSLALTMLVGSPSRIVAVSTHSEPTDPLLEFAVRRGMLGRLTVHQLVSVDDRDRFRQILDDEFDAEPGLEVVIDDVSDRLSTGLHLFETLFPHLTAGGTYVVEGWSFDHFVLEGYLSALDADDRARIDELRAEAVERTHTAKGEVLEAIVPMLVAALRARPDIVSGLEVTQTSVVVTRGPAPIAAPFRLADLDPSVPA
jgi:hypothetical protein